MKSRQLAAIAVIMSLGVLPIAPGGVAALPSGYTERLDVYAAGSNALWYVTLSGVNASAPAISKAEAVSGLTSYNLTAIKTTSWDSDFQVFGPQGYNLLHLPFIPDQGLFLTLSASDASAATSAVSAFDSYLAAAFVPLSNGSGTYSYFSPVSFSLIVPGTLLRLIPQSAGGFASLISPTQLIAQASPFVTLSGQKAASGFSHSLTVGSIKLAALASGTLQLLTLFGSSPSSIQPSKLASTSTIYLRSLDGLISSKDKATVRNSDANFSGSYSYTLNQTSRVKALNLTLLQSPAVAIATRILDKGALNSGDTLAVTLSVKNIVSQPVQNFTVRDDWWKSYPGFFAFSSGTANFTIPSIGGGQGDSRTYVLKVNSSQKGEITIPPVTGSYSYQSGGIRYNGTAVFNEAQVVVGMVEPALAINIQPSGASGNPLGTPENFTVTVTNIGSGPALNVKVANSTKQSLAVGGTTVVGVPVKFTSIIQSNISRFFTVSWQTPEGETRLLRSSLATLFFTHSSMEVGFGRVVVNATMAPLPSSRMNITLKYTTSNSGHAPVTGIFAAQPIPPGLECGKTSGNITCSNGVISLRYSNLQTGATKRASVWFVVSQTSVIFTPARFNVTTSGFTFTGVSGGIAAPAGLSVSKTLSPNPLFRGMTSTVVVDASNRGGYVLYNATISASADSFDSLATSQGVTQKFFEALNPGSSFSFNYTVKVEGGGSGTFKASAVAVQLLFGGMRFNFDLPQGNATLLRPLQASISASPSSPVEGSSFGVQLSVSNPSPVQVSHVHFALKLPPGLRVLGLTNANVTNGAVTIDIPSLTAGGTYSANVTLSASSGLSLALKDDNTLSFSYSGQEVSGFLPNQSVTVHEDVLTRYAFPIAIALLAVLAAALTIRRRVTPATAPASRQ